MITTTRAARAPGLTRSYQLPIEALLVVATIAGACNGDRSSTLPEDSAAAVAILERCPAGDGLWREALARAREPADLDPIGAAARRAHSVCPSQWEPAWVQGEILFRNAEFVSARDPLEDALRLAAANTDATGIACASNRLGSLATFRGELPLAAELFMRALDASRTAARRDLEAFVLNNLADVHRAQGHFPEAVTTLDQATRALSELGLDKPARDARTNGAMLVAGMGDYHAGLEILEAVHREASAAQDPDGASLAALNLALIELARGELELARVWFGRIADGDPYYEVWRGYGLALVGTASGEYEAAHDQLQRVRHVAQEKELAQESVLIEIALTELLYRRGDYTAAKRELMRIIARAASIDSREYALWLAEWLLGRTELARGDQVAGIAALRRAISIFESQHHRLDPLGEGLHFLLERSDPYVDLAVALTRSKAPAAEILAVIESAHATTLRRMLGSTMGERVLPSLDSLQASLPAGTVLIDYLIGSNAGVAMVVSREGARARLIAGWAELSGPLQRYRRALVRPLVDFVALSDADHDIKSAWADGWKLTQLLLVPLGPKVEHARRLVIIPDRDLALLPFASLPATKEAGYIGEKIEIAIMPFAGPLPQPIAPQGRVLIAGDPLPDPAREFPRLARAALELDGVEKIWQSRGPERWERHESSRQRFEQAAAGSYDLRHFATHAIASTTDPRRCALVFSGGDRLGLDRIARMRLGEPVVVLSACRTGEGEIIPGQGVVGLSWAFMLGGARSVTASLWSVDDASTAELMIEFHRALAAGRDVVGAIHDAQAVIRQRHPHPAWWASFVTMLRPQYLQDG